MPASHQPHSRRRPRAAVRAQTLAFNADAVAIALALALAALIRFNLLPHVRW
jgi:hypothetical protein